MRWLGIVVVAVVGCAPVGGRQPGPKAAEGESGAESGGTSSDPTASFPEGVDDGVRKAAEACAKDEAAACLALGVAYSNGSGGLTSDESRADDLYERACDLGDIRGCNNLAVAYEKGQGRPVDLKRAVGLYEKNCRAEHALACRNLGRAWRDGLGMPADPARAREAFDSAKKLSERDCNEGVAEGCSNLGFMYRSGDEGLPKDEAQAAKYLKRACDMGYRAVCGRVHASK